MNQENAYSKGFEVKYLLKSKTGVNVVEFLILQPCERVLYLPVNKHSPENKHIPKISIANI